MAWRNLSVKFIAQSHVVYAVPGFKVVYEKSVCLAARGRPISRLGMDAKSLQPYSCCNEGNLGCFCMRSAVPNIVFDFFREQG